MAALQQEQIELGVSEVGSFFQCVLSDVAHFTKMQRVIVPKRWFASTIGGTFDRLLICRRSYLGTFLALAVGFVLTMSAQPRQTAFSQAPDRNEEQAEFLLAGLKDNRERLQSGIYRAYGNKVDDDPKWGELRGDVEIFCAFDIVEDLLRYDFVEPQRRLKSAPAASGALWELSRSGGKYASTPDQSICWTIAEPKSASIRPPEIKRCGGFTPLDTRSLGLLFWADLSREHSFPALYKSFGRKTLVDVTDESDGVFRARWVEGERRDSFWFNTKQGFSIIRLEVQYQRASARSERERWSEPQMVSEVTWTEQSDVWVPESFHIEDRHLEPRILSLALAFEWESINKAVPEHLFAAEGFDLPTGTVFVDTRLGRPVIVGRVGEEPPEKAKPVGWSRLQWSLIIVNVLIVLLLLAILLVRYLRWREAS